MEKYTYYIYFLTNKNNNVLYIGVTNNLYRRLSEHKQKLIDGFTKQYNCYKLVYWEEYRDIKDAIKREKQLKNWHREWKNNLVKENNSEWRDLSDDIIMRS